MAYKRIVLATDGSTTAETAERVAASIAAATKGKMIVVHAYDDPSKAEAAVARALHIAQERGTKVDVILSADQPADAILTAAEQTEAEMIVTGSRGFFRAEQLIGSVVRKVATHAPCDVLLTRPRAGGEPPRDPPYQRMLVATDGSITADRASRKGYALAKSLGVELTLVFVGHPKTGELILQDTVATMGEDAVPTETVVKAGEPAKAIIDAARESGCDLVVVGNRGLAGARGAILGSVPRDVAELAECDVLIARTIAQSLEEIGKDDGGIVATGDHKAAVYRDRKGAVHAMSAKCTHMGCTVRWNPAEKTWDCPCHGSRFAADGKVVNGPAAKALERTEL